MFRLPLRKPSPSLPPPSPALSRFEFFDVPRLFNLIDRELELVEPGDRYVDDLLAASHHPQTCKEMPAQAKTTRDSVLEFLSHNPRGHTVPDPDQQVAPGYTFWMRLGSQLPLSFQDVFPPVSMAGSISLRLGHSVNLDYYLGHIGYHVLPPARGHHYAQRACQLLLSLARAHGQKVLWLTCNPENLPSRRTIERIGATLVNIVTVPSDNSLYSQGDRHKCRYRLVL
ncbi:MAG: GNAT family N-acetyltransferase [Phycisphaerales bacterium]|nr:GNAT family N-acetyltransferase [Phycisphaerales bacterium]